MRNGGKAVALVLGLHFLGQVPDADHQHSDVAECAWSTCPFDRNEDARPFHLELLSRGNWVAAS